jgi:hypothetical protein
MRTLLQVNKKPTNGVFPTAPVKPVTAAWVEKRRQPTARSIVDVVRRDELSCLTLQFLYNQSCIYTVRPLI